MFHNRELEFETFAEVVEARLREDEAERQAASKPAMTAADAARIEALVPDSDPTARAYAAGHRLQAAAVEAMVEQ